MPPREASNAPTSPSPADQLKRIDIGQDGKETTEDERLRTFVLGEVEKAKKKLSPQALDRLVKAIAEVLSRRESDRAKIREAVQAKLKELSVDVEEQKGKKSILLAFADEVRDYIPGDFRLKTKNELEKIGSLSPEELAELKKQIESHPKKMEKFIHGWARDTKWREFVKKNNPESFRILTEMFDGYCKTYNIKNPEGDIGEIFDKRAKAEKLRAKLREKTKELEGDILEALELARKGTQLSKLDKLSYTKKIFFLKRSAESLYEDLQTDFANAAVKLGDADFTREVNVAYNSLRTTVPQLEAFGWKNELNDTDQNIYWMHNAAKLDAVLQGIRGKVVVADLSIIDGKASGKARTIEEMGKQFQQVWFQEINSKTFTEFLKALKQSGNANVTELYKLLGKDLMHKFALRWNLGDPEDTGKEYTKAQKALQETDPGLYRQTVVAFKKYREAFVIDASKSYPAMESFLSKYIPDSKKREECLKEIFAASGKSTLRTITETFRKHIKNEDSLDRTLMELVEVLEKDSQRNQTRKDIEAVEVNGWSSTMKVSDCAKNIKESSILGLSNEEKMLLRRSETWKELASHPNEELRATLNVFKKLASKKILGPDDAKALEALEKSLNLGKQAREAQAIRQNQNLRKQAVRAVQDVRTAEKTGGEKAVQAYYQSKDFTKLDNQIISAGTRITAEETIAEKADSLSSTLAALGLGKYTFEDIQKHEWLRKEIMMRIGAHPDPSPEMLDLQNKIARLIERDLTDRQIEGTINAYHSDTAISKYQSTGVKESYSAQREDISSRIPGTLPQGNEATSYEALRASAVSVPNSSVSSLTQELDAGHPVIIGDFIVNRDESELRIVGKNFEVEIDQRYANTALALASIGDRLNFSEIVPSIKHIVEETQGNELFTQMRFGVSKRHETELIKLVASTLGAQYDSSLTEPNQLIRSVESWQSVQTGTPSLLELARRNGLTRANGTIEPTVFARAILGKQKIQESPRDTVLA